MGRLTVSADLGVAGHNGPASFLLLRRLPVIPLQQKRKKKNQQGHFLSDKGPQPESCVFLPKSMGGVFQLST